jgi:hypothetical protein
MGRHASIRLKKVVATIRKSTETVIRPVSKRSDQKTCCDREHRANALSRAHPWHRPLWVKEPAIEAAEGSGRERMRIGAPLRMKSRKRSALQHRRLLLLEYQFRTQSCHQQDRREWRGCRMFLATATLVPLTSSGRPQLSPC